MYLYKKLDGGRNVRGLLGCSTPQPERAGLVEINVKEFGAIQEKMKSDEQLLKDSLGPTKIATLEARVAALEGN